MDCRIKGNEDCPWRMIRFNWIGYYSFPDSFPIAVLIEDAASS